MSIIETGNPKCIEDFSLCTEEENFGMTTKEVKEFCPLLGKDGYLNVEDCDEIITRMCAGVVITIEKFNKLSGVRCYHLERKGEYFVNRPCDCTKVDYKTLGCGDPYFKYSKRVQTLLNQRKLDFNRFHLDQQEKIMEKAKKNGKWFILNPSNSR